MLLDSGLDRKFWSKAVLCAVYLINRSLNKKGFVPAKLWYGKDPDYNKLHIFGTKAYLLTPKQKRRDKFEPNGKKYIFVGYNPEGFHLLDVDGNCTVIGRDVIFDESDASLKNKIENVITEEKNYINPSVDIENIENVIIDDSIENIVIDNDDDMLCQYAYFTCFNDVTNFEDACKSDDWPKWRNAIAEELDAMDKNCVWDIVKRPEDVKTVSTRWVFRTKRCGDDSFIYKARLVARGFEVQRDFDLKEIYSPVAQLSTLRILLCICLKADLHVQQLDIKNAFLNGTLDDANVYLDVPEGLKLESNRNKKDFALRLNKAIYGLKEAPLAWNRTFNEFVISLGFKRSIYDECLYSKNDLVYLLLYVDDILICSADVNVIRPS